MIKYKNFIILEDTNYYYVGYEIRMTVLKTNGTRKPGNLLRRLWRGIKIWRTEEDAKNFIDVITDRNHPEHRIYVRRLPRLQRFKLLGDYYD